ncbi:hypothetical protein J4467_02595 [Candidatus Woesearchaeota archaeon]|nr:hypothetical protein [Candidatus Woesearchaeota archaeon]
MVTKKKHLYTYYEVKITKKMVKINTFEATITRLDLQENNGIITGSVDFAYKQGLTGSLPFNPSDHTWTRHYFIGKKAIVIAIEAERCQQPRMALSIALEEPFLELSIVKDLID